MCSQHDFWHYISAKVAQLTKNRHTSFRDAKTATHHSRNFCQTACHWITAGGYWPLFSSTTVAAMCLHAASLSLYQWAKNAINALVNANNMLTAASLPVLITIDSCSDSISTILSLSKCASMHLNNASLPWYTKKLRHFSSWSLRYALRRLSQQRAISTHKANDNNLVYLSAEYVRILSKCVCTSGRGGSVLRCIADVKCIHLYALTVAVGKNPVMYLSSLSRRLVTWL